LIGVSAIKLPTVSPPFRRSLAIRLSNAGAVLLRESVKEKSSDSCKLAQIGSGAGFYEVRGRPRGCGAIPATWRERYPVSLLRAVTRQTDQGAMLAHAGSGVAGRDDL